MRRPLAAALGLALIAAAGAGLLAALDRPPALEFQALRDAEGFRRLAAGGEASAGNPAALMLGGELGASAEEAPPQGEALCRRLWRTPEIPAEGPADSPRRMAVFSDANCPYCRALDGVVAELAADRPDLRILHHEWPALGPTSVLAARAALAAEAQGGFRALQRRLLRTPFRITQSYVEAAAAEQGLDVARLRADMEGPEVARALAATDSVARALGLHGTPVVVIGGTLIEGAADRALIETVLEAEAGRADAPC